MPSADKRQRKKENARAAREEREAALKKRKRNRTIRNGGIATAIFVVAFGLLTLLTHNDKKKPTAGTTTTSTTTKALPTSGVTGTIKTNLGTIVLALDTKNDPKGAGRFVALAEAGKYNGSSWTRIVKDFVIQGGAPGGDPSKSVGNAVVGEVPKDHYPVGSIAAAKGDADPAGTFDSQFFIVTGAAQGASLPNDYARFGSVKSGMDVVKKIEALPVDAKDAPKSKASIDTVTISGT